MKKIFALLFSVGTFLSFSFIKMEGPFGVKKNTYEKIVCHLETNSIFHAIIKNSFSVSFYSDVFFYSNQTGYMVACIMLDHGAHILDYSNDDILEVDDLILKFFQGNKLLNNTKKFNLLVVKDKPGLKIFDVEWSKTKINNSGNELLLKDLQSKKEEIINVEKNDIKIFQLQKTIDFSSLTISNQDDQVTISKNEGKPICFQKALHNYYKKTKNLTFIEKIMNIKKNDPREVLIERKIDEQGVYGVINMVESLKKNTASCDLLKKSTILRVDAVLKGDKGENSIICGLVEDNKTKENFYWITDLKQDISNLIN